MGGGWIERYNVMFDVMRDALVDSTWKKMFDSFPTADSDHRISAGGVSGKCTRP